MEQTNTPQENSLATGQIGRLIARFAIPSVIAMVVNSLYNIVDQIFIGQGIGYLGNGATNVVFLITLITLSLSLLFGDGAAAFFSLRLGEGKKDLAAKGVGSMALALCALSLLCLGACALFLQPILRLFGATDQIMPLAYDYGRIIIIGLPFIMLSTALNAVIRADGSPKFAMASMISGAAVNLLLDPLLIFSFGWGIQGAAVATVTGQAVSFSLSVSYLPRMKQVRLTRKSFSISFPVTGRIMALGSSSFIDQISFALVMAVNNNLIVHYGAQSAYGSEIPLTSFGIAMKVQQILFAVVLGISVGMQPVTGFNYGAQNYARVKKACRVAIGCASTACLAGTIVFLCLPGPLMQLFGSPDSTLFTAFSEKFFRTYFLLVIFLGFQTVMGIFFQSIGRPLRAAVISVSYQIVFRIGCAVLLSALWGLDGVLWSGPLADLLTFLLAVPLGLSVLKEMKEAERARSKQRE